LANADLGIVPKQADSFGNEAYSTKIMESCLKVSAVVSSHERKSTRSISIIRSSNSSESGNAEAMADAMLQVIKNPAKREALIAKGFEYVARHSWDQKRKNT